MIEVALGLAVAGVSWVVGWGVARWLRSQWT